jgi:hypothetical protein
MHDKYTLTAIVMFAAILGMSTIVPALAAPGNPRSQATTAVCHLFEEEIDEETGEITPAHWGVLYTSSQGATNGHLKHGDSLIGDVTDPDAEPPTITVDDCIAQTVPEPVPEE